VKKTVTTLADGRELIYFDSGDSESRGEYPDRRPLEPMHRAAQTRFDQVQGEWIAIAAHRQNRTYKPPADQCPLCPSRDGRMTEVPAEDYDVVVFENRFPTFTERAPGGRGRCEVVCFTSDHHRSFRELTLDQVRTVVETWADRTEELSRLDGVRWVFPFENRGAEIGVTLPHPHGQIYAYPYLPPIPSRVLENVRRHHEETGGDLFAERLAAERAGPRVVTAGEHWTAFVPQAARWPVEVHLYPHRKVPDIPALTEPERADFAAVYRDVLSRLDALYGLPLPYIAAWQQAPVGPDSAADRGLWHLHLRVFSIRRSADKIKYLAGSESGAGAFLNDVLPEDTAARLREAAS
jgi:UDPglucose--hexose-1-phosphate uridylyltransferase